MALIGRLFVILFAFLAACLVAGMIVVGAIMFPEFSDLGAGPVDPGASNARRITFEYVMLKGVNDSLDDAKLLVKLLKGIPAKINLIPFNPWPGTAYECSDWDQIERFSEYIFNAGYSSPVRTPRGRDILAACGQLKSETEKLSARERQALRAMAMTD